MTQSNQGHISARPLESERDVRIAALEAELAKAIALNADIVREDDAMHKRLFARITALEAYVLEVESELGCEPGGALTVIRRCKDADAANMERFRQMQTDLKHATEHLDAKSNAITELMAKRGQLPSERAPDYGVPTPDYGVVAAIGKSGR